MQSESLHPAGLTLADCEETAAALSVINAAAEELHASRSELQRRLWAERQQQVVGRNCPDNEAAAWNHFQATAERKFHEVRRKAADRAAAAAKRHAEVQAAEALAGQRNLECALGRVLQDTDAGRLAGQALIRLAGGLPVSTASAEAASAWSRVAELSRRALCELPIPPPTIPPPSAEIESLNHLLNNEIEG
jgi:hypothetical protein